MKVMPEYTGLYFTPFSSDLHIMHIMCDAVIMSHYARNLGSGNIQNTTHRNNMVKGYKFAPNCDIIIIDNKYVIIIM